MIRLISFSSLLKIPSVKEKVVSEIGLLSRENDQWIKPILYELGLYVTMNEDIPPEIQAGKHRNLDGEVVVGYFYVGFERRDSEWRDSKYCTMSAYIEGAKTATGKRDTELISDLYNASREGIGDSGFQHMCLNAIGDLSGKSGNKDAADIVDDYEQTLAYINHLKGIQLDVRGYLEKFE
jgi:hypothetical protein